jgi:hypothetical protein
MMRPYGRGAVPPGGLCRYIDADAGFTISHPYWVWCKNLATQERIKRGLPIPYDWDAVFDRQFCIATPRGCVEVPDEPIETAPNWLQVAAQFGAALARWILSGLPLVTWDQFKARHLQCTGDDVSPRCPHFTTFKSIGLTKCGKCGCSTVKLYLATERCPIGRWSALR